jgi:imidazoleglycerol-phosphate dehydratase
MSKGTPGVRYAEVERETEETRVQVVLDLDGGTKQDLSTGIGFFDHMLGLFAFHGRVDLGIKAEGDLHVDDHHLVEDVGIVLGSAIREALRETENIARFGSTHTPMDEALVLCAVDLSGRGHLFYDLPFRRELLGDLSTENVREFFRALALHSGMTIHLRKVCGDNDHHLCEAAFKGFGLALLQATQPAERQGGVSTKGKID